KRSGIILTHFGMILLLLGELATSLFAVESRMTIDEGQTVGWSEDTRAGELAVIDPSAPDADTVVAFPEGALSAGATLRHATLPFELVIDEFHANSELLGPRQAPAGSVSKATAGGGRGVVLVPRERSAGTESAVDMASAYVTVRADGKPLGTWLLSYWFDQPQAVVAGGRTFLVALRFERHYKPYTMTLLKFSHDRYIGTNIPRNFSSRIRLVDPAANEDREVLIRMNEPLRHAGETYYQASFKPGDKTTILQVVRNPAWTMPYVACTVGGLGMLVHFGIMLWAFIRRAPAAAAAAPEGAPVAAAPPPRGIGSWAFPLAVVALVADWIAGSLRAPRAAEGGFDYAAFGDIPVTFDGRVLPMDTLARSSLQAISGRQATKAPADSVPPADWSKQPAGEWKSVPATRWLADVMAGTERAEHYRVFRIDHPGVLGMLGLDETRNPRLFSFHEILEQQEKLEEQINRVMEVDAKKRDPFQRKVADLYERLQVYLRLAEVSSLYLAAPAKAGGEWEPMGRYLPTRHGQIPESTPSARAILDLLSAYHDGKAADFNRAVATGLGVAAETAPSQASMAKFEAFFNRVDPFYRAQVAYVLVFVLGCVSWLGWSRPLGRAAFALLFLALFVHTFGLAARIAISGRPPVTNLYSSAVFIAWVGVLLAAVLEFFYRNVVASVTSAVMGFTSLLVAHHLAGDGDTMRQMQAVLDTNFWLATHVVAITLGYAATFLAGVLAVFYVVSGVFSGFLTAKKPGRAEADAPAKTLPRMVYAILCFSMLFSFLGTVLGGIWADQSWGRFWGWDPKENGAVLIVIWIALILHARWGGMARDRGVMLLAVFGNIVTAWSWFGTNMLGVGLHSYGFMDSALFWLLMFVASQMAVIALGNLPLEKWRSFRKAAA
ncbi:MAG: cytochrome c biogenesis protein CcsA, partial [Planctomycetia bacterium]|nr:cytochrome c biogenesis protein CcsA [Planctomycetia bacterium]